MAGIIIASMFVNVILSVHDAKSKNSICNDVILCFPP